MKSNTSTSFIKGNSTKVSTKVFQAEQESECFTFRELLKRKPNQFKDWLVGTGFLTKGGSVLIQGEPGAGKSKFTQHLAFSLALGMPFLGLVPQKALRVLYVQAEDSVDDLIESVKGFCTQNEMPEDSITQIDKNLQIQTLIGVAGEKFLEKLKERVEAFKPEVVVTDPLLAFSGCDLTFQNEVSEFLRRGVGAYLRQKQCGWICVHHSSKGAAKFGGSKVSKGLGSIEISAFFRGVIDLETKGGDRDTLVMEIAKRHRQAGLLAMDGSHTRSQVIRMSKGHIGWELLDASAVGALKGKAGRPSKSKTEEVQALIEALTKKGASNAAITKAISEKFGYSTKQAGRLLKKHTAEPEASAADKSEAEPEEVTAEEEDQQIDTELDTMDLPDLDDDSDEGPDGLDLQDIVTM